MTVPVLGYATPALAGYTSPRGRAGVVYILSALYLVVTLAYAGALYLQGKLLERALAGVRPTVAEATANDSRVRALAVCYLAVYVGLAVVFLMWEYRSCVNLRAFGVEPEYTAGLAVGSFFIPFLNLFRPYQAMAELYRESGSGQDEGGGVGLVGWWWAAWVIMGAVSMGLTRLGPRDKSLENLVDGNWRIFWSGLLPLLPFFLMVGVVHSITRRQEGRALQGGAVG